MSTPNAATTIREQLGHRALCMLGATNLLDTGEGLQFKIGTNPGKVTHITIALEPTDTYRVTFSRVRRFEVTELAEVSGVYVDALHATISERTGLLTSMGTMGARA